MSTSYGIHDIPQLNINIEYALSIGNVNKIPSQTGLSVSPNLQASTIFSDGTFLKIEEEQTILQILERNGFIHGESIQVEAFLFDDAEEEKLIPLKFIKQKKEIENDLLLDNNQMFQDRIEPTPDTVEYYFDIRVDKEIPTSDYGVTGTNNSNTAGLDGVGIEKETRSLKGPNIYRSPVTEDDIEDCN